MVMELVLLRHGQSTWNLENLFTGWTDVPLTEAGEEEARQAGRLMAEEGFRFGVVHTSLLLRAIHTAEIALREMGLHWIPVRRHWRLNERHYGALQGLNKKETAEKHGAEQVLIWRRSYSTPPPALEPDDARHPRHDKRYAQLPPDLHPAAEQLSDVVRRMLPYWSDFRVPGLLSRRTPLIVAHCNRLRALVKHLDGLTQEEVIDLNIPTCIPLVYELDEDLRPVSKRYLGDPEAAAKAAEALAKQASV